MDEPHFQFGLRSVFVAVTALAFMLAVGPFITVEVTIGGLVFITVGSYFL